MRKPAVPVRAMKYKIVLVKGEEVRIMFKKILLILLLFAASVLGGALSTIVFQPKEACAGCAALPTQVTCTPTITTTCGYSGSCGSNRWFVKNV